jgi:hypothetical protein
MFAHHLVMSMAATVVFEIEASWISETGGTPVLLHSYGFSLNFNIRRGAQLTLAPAGLRLHGVL